MSLDIPIGQALDELVAMVVMEWHKGAGNRAISGIGEYESSEYWYTTDGLRQSPRITDTFANMHAWSPSTDIRAAWHTILVIERLGWWIELWYGNGLFGPKKRAGCTIGAYGDDDTKFDAMADTMPHAICLAALEAKGYKP